METVLLLIPAEAPFHEWDVFFDEQRLDSFNISHDDPPTVTILRAAVF